jgi:hypothetical protein
MAATSTDRDIQKYHMVQVNTRYLQGLNDLNKWLESNGVFHTHLHLVEEYLDQGKNYVVY